MEFHVIKVENIIAGILNHGRLGKLAFKEPLQGAAVIILLLKLNYTLI